MAKAAERSSKRYHVPVNIILAIAAAESSYMLDAVNGDTNDYGIMQVNLTYHKKYDKEKLLTDIEYSVDAGTEVFYWFYSRYPLDEAIMRYNCGTRPGCIEKKKVKKYLERVKSFL